MNRKERRAAASQARPPVHGLASDRPAGASARIAEQFALALRHHRAGRLVEAKGLYEQICALDPAHVGSLHFLGVLAQQLGRTDVAIELIGRALALKPDDADAHYNLGNALADRGKLDEAVAHYERALALKPDQADVHNNLGNALKGQSELEAAIACYRRALTLEPDFAEAHNNLGNALKDQGQLTEAMACYERALALAPNHAEVHNNLGNALKDQGKLAESMACYGRALAIKPGYAEARCNLGNALQEQGRLAEAVAQYERALALKPDYADAHYHLGNALKDQGKLAEAIARYERTLALTPGRADVHNDLGNALRERGKFAEAMACYERALVLEPNLAEAHYNIGNALQEQGELADALASYERALALQPDYAEAKFARCMAQLPILCMDEREIDERRAAYEQHLRALCEDAERGRTAGDLAKAVGSAQPFFLAYQGRDDRELQSLYGSLICRIMAERYPPAALAEPPAPGEPVKVGFVSGYFYDHSVWKIPMRGWLSRLDRRRFRIFGYHTGIKQDAETKAAAAACDRFVQGPLPLARWREVILGDLPHVLIYPEIGMDGVSTQLAAQRLAPIQCNGLGHPDTSGFPTLDYALSSDLMEPLDGQDLYTERLVRLPNLSVYYEPLDRRKVSLDRSDLGLRPTATVYWCGQSLFKYLPQLDQVFPRIAREAGECQFAFIRHQSGQITDLFRKRLERAFAALGSRAADYCVVLPPLDPHRFVAAIGQCDIILDSIEWSGNNSTMESLAQGLPIVAMTGAMMRGRHTMAILRMMGVTETITKSIDDYVSTAVRLACDVPWRMAVQSRIRENRHRVYRDGTCISALEEFLNDAARRGLGKE
jgi:protein O-GlcNAc transferase